jgi:hypothetical protein
VGAPREKFNGEAKMTDSTAKLKWSEKEPPVEISNIIDLDSWLDKLTAATNPEYPSVICLYVHGYEVGIGLGLSQSFIHLEHESGKSPYLITVGDSAAKGVVAFYLYGNHHTEISRRHLISILKARQVVREFFAIGNRPLSVEWMEI